MKINTRFFHVALPFAIFFLAVAYFLVRISYQPLFDWDEAIYARVAYELKSSELWWVLTNGGVPWFHKPPLQFWITSLAFTLFDNLELAARMASVLAGAATASVVFLFTQHLRNWKAGLVAVVIILTTAHFVDASRDGMLDAMLSLWIVVSFFAATLALKNPRWWLLAGFAVGAAVMTKGAAGVVAPMTLLIGVALHSARWQILRSGWFWGGIATALLVILPWHIVMFLQYNPLFYDEYIAYHVLMRTQEGIEGHAGTWIDYVLTMRDRGFPWVFAYPIAAGFLLVQTIQNQARRNQVFLLVGIVLIAVLYGFVVQSKLSQYIIPLYPLFAVAIAVVIGDVLARIGKGIGQYVVLLLLSVLTIAGAFQVRVLYRWHGGESPTSVREINGVRLLGATMDSTRPLLVVAGVKWWPSAAFYSNGRTPINRPSPELLQEIVLNAPQGVDVLLGKGETFIDPPGTARENFGESEDYQYFRLYFVE